MKRLSPYQQNIIAATGCAVEDVDRIEDIMRNHIVHSTLDWLKPEQFTDAARSADFWFRELLEMGWTRIPGGGLKMPPNPLAGSP